MSHSSPFIHLTLNAGSRIRNICVYGKSESKSEAYEACFKNTARTTLWKVQLNQPSRCSN